MLAVKKLPALPECVRVRVLSLSSPVAAQCPRRYERAKCNLQALGFQVSEGRYARSQLGHLVAEPEARAQDFIEAWRDPDVDILWSVIGGMSTHQILEHLPFEELARTPKLVIGYSDTTSLLIALYAKCGMPSIYGPALMPQLGEVEGPHPYALESLRRALGPQPMGLLPAGTEVVEEKLSWEKHDVRKRVAVAQSTRRTVRPGRATGPIIAANVGTMLTLAGTSYFPDLSGAILVLEDDEEESVDTIDRFLTQLRQLGVYGQIAALCFGRFPTQVGLDDATLSSIVLRATKGYDLPIATGFEVGHVDPILSIPIGLRGSFDSERLELRVDESLFG